MASDPPVGTPRSALTFDRAAFERVLARAAELAEHDGLTEAQIVEVAREVGIPPEFVRQALAEERAHGAVRSDREWITQLVGERWVSASRIVPGSPTQALTTLDRWMQAEECMRQKRRIADRVAWEARRDLVGNLKRGLNFTGRHYALARTTDVTATAADVGDQRCLVRLDADLHAPRRKTFRWTAFCAGAGGLGAAMPFVLTADPALSIPMIAGSAILGSLGLVGGLANVRAHSRLITRVQLALEQALDQLGHAPAAASPSVIGLLADVVLGPR